MVIDNFLSLQCKFHSKRIFWSFCELSPPKGNKEKHRRRKKKEEKKYAFSWDDTKTYTFWIYKRINLVSWQMYLIFLPPPIVPYRLYADNIPTREFSFPFSFFPARDNRHWPENVHGQPSLLPPARRYV